MTEQEAAKSVEGSEQEDCHIKFFKISDDSDDDNDDDSNEQSIEKDLKELSEKLEGKMCQQDIRFIIEQTKLLSKHFPYRSLEDLVNISFSTLVRTLSARVFQSKKAMESLKNDTKDDTTDHSSDDSN